MEGSKSSFLCASCSACRALQVRDAHLTPGLRMDANLPSHFTVLLEPLYFLHTVGLAGLDCCFVQVAEDEHRHTHTQTYVRTHTHTHTWLFLLHCRRGRLWGLCRDRRWLEVGRGRRLLVLRGRDRGWVWLIHCPVLFGNGHNGGIVLLTEFQPRAWRSSCNS